MTTHTPGPWKYGFECADPEWAIVTLDVPRGKIIANVNADHRQEANARLIAAAPELLAACQSILGHWESGNFSREHDLWNGLRAAITKATS